MVTFDWLLFELKLPFLSFEGLFLQFSYSNLKARNKWAKKEPQYRNPPANNRGETQWHF